MGLKSIFALLAITVLVAASPIPPDEIGTNIVGGAEAREGEFPYIVSLSRSGSHFCGGTLLNANTVVTAAHCSTNQNTFDVRVRAGSVDRDFGGTLVGVSSIRTHPDYNSNTYDSDIAIWKLSTSLNQSPVIKYATLAASGSDPASGTYTTVAGWGDTSSGGSSPTSLRKVDVPIVSRSTCNSNYNGRITTNMLCAAEAQGGKDACQGDSGGPIVNRSSRVLLGVVSWGEGCAVAGKPGVYSRIGSLRSFIDQNL